jgi:cytochrome c
MRIVLVLPLLLIACRPEAPDDVRAAVARHGCGSCHVIAGIPGADGRTGPSLVSMADQVYVAGVVPNDRQTLAQFIRDPQSIDPRSAMPNLPVTEDEARLIADYLRVAR